MSRSGSPAWAWAMVVCLLLANVAGAWHGVAHAMPRAAVQDAGAACALASRSAGQPGASAVEASWLDALFAHHMKGQGHADCLSFDHLTQSHGMPVALAHLPLLARAESWSTPTPVRKALARVLRPFNARAPPVLA